MQPSDYVQIPLKRKSQNNIQSRLYGRPIFSL
jgi:hypothetical protein